MYNKNTFLKITALMYKQEHISENYSYMKVKQAALWSTDLPITQNAKTSGDQQITPWTRWKVRPVPGRNPRVGCHFLFQGIFLAQGWNVRLLHRLADSLALLSPGKPPKAPAEIKFHYYSGTTNHSEGH